jgi:hypothetical protein
MIMHGPEDNFSRLKAVGSIPPDLEGQVGLIVAEVASEVRE